MQGKKQSFAEKQREMGEIGGLLTPAKFPLNIYSSRKCAVTLDCAVWVGKSW
jgi:hypothetical protein